MAKSDPEALAEALRANLRRRKERMRASQSSAEPVENHGSDEEGDAPVPETAARPGAWVDLGTGS